jgi:hypothetical protein
VPKGVLVRVQLKAPNTWGSLAIQVGICRRKILETPSYQNILTAGSSDSLLRPAGHTERYSVVGVVEHELVTPVECFDMILAPLWLISPGTNPGVKGSIPAGAAIFVATSPAIIQLWRHCLDRGKGTV